MGMGRRASRRGGKEKAKLFFLARLHVNRGEEGGKRKVARPAILNPLDSGPMAGRGKRKTRETKKGKEGEREGRKRNRSIRPF